MERHTSKPSLAVLAVIGFILFIFTNWWPLFSMMFGITSEEDYPEPKAAITKQEADEAARAWVEQTAKAAPEDSFVMYQTESELSGYLQKNDLLVDYPEQLSKLVPTEYYQVEVRTDEEDYLVDVHLNEQRVVGWRQINAPAASEAPNAEAAAQYLREQGLEGFELKGEADGALVYVKPDARIGDAVLQASVREANGQLLGYELSFELPTDFLRWYEDQEQSRASLEWVGLLLQLITLFGAVAAAVAYRGRISYQRGLFLASSYFVLESIYNINMYPAFRTMDPESGHLIAVFTIVFQEIVYLVIAGMLYLALVSGDGMWKHLGQDPWKRWQADDFGEHVRSSMRIGYLLAFPVLGLQGLIYVAGDVFADVWSIEDALFSNRNLLNPLLFPLLAWRAAIMEEGIYRLFMIVVFLKLFGGMFRLARLERLNRMHVHTALALLAAGMIWAIGHVSYPVFPAYTRFVEVTILGLAFGAIFLRYGFIAAIFTHVVLDSILMALSIMFTGENPAQSVPAGLFYLALPALVGQTIYALHRGRRRPART